MRPIYVAAAALLVVGCTSPTASRYESNDVGRMIETSEGVIVSSRVVGISDEPKGYGPLAGAAIGATGAGLSIGSGSGSTVAAVIGGLIGLGAGYIAEQMARTRDGIEYVVRTPDGRVMMLVQNRDKAEEPLPPGTSVLVQYSGSYTRVIEKPENLEDHWKNPDAPGGGPRPSTQSDPGASRPMQGGPTVPMPVPVGRSGSDDRSPFAPPAQQPLHQY